MKILVFPAIQRSCSIKRTWKGFSLTWPPAPFVVCCPKSLGSKKLSQSEYLGTLFHHLYCPLSNTLGQYTFYSQPFLPTPQDAGIIPNLLGPNPGLIEIKKKKSMREKMFLDSSADIATGRSWLCYLALSSWPARHRLCYFTVHPANHVTQLLQSVLML